MLIMVLIIFNPLQCTDIYIKKNMLIKSKMIKKYFLLKILLKITI